MEMFKNSFGLMKALGYDYDLNDFDSNKARQEGNVFFREGKFAKALSHYSKALMYAKADEEKAALALANRSAVLLAIGYYKECIGDVKLALSKNYPEALSYKLHQRLAACYTMLGESSLAEHHFELCCKLIKQHVSSSQQEEKLNSAKKDFENGVTPKIEKLNVKYHKVPDSVSYGDHPDFPGVSSALKLVENVEFGKHYVAQQKINPGDILIIEGPLVSSLCEKVIKDDPPEFNRNGEIKEKETVTSFTFCYHCFKNCLNLTPCGNCLYAMFCSEDCKIAAEETYHKAECVARTEYTANRRPHDFTSNSLMVIICCKIVSTFGIDACIQAMENPADALPVLGDLLSMPKFEYPPGIMMRVKELASLMATHGFKQHGERQTLLANFIIMAMMVYKSCSSHINFPQYHAESDIYDAGFVIGWGIFFHNTRLVHSCAANTIGIMYQGKVQVCYAALPIEPGEKITHEYIAGGVDEMGVEDRRELVREIFNFTCKCEACTKGWVSTMYFVDNEKLRKFPRFHPLFCAVTDHVETLYYNRGLDNLLDKNFIQNCCELRDMFLQFDVPRTDIMFNNICRVIQLAMQYTAMQFVRNGEGDHFLFSSQIDIEQELEETTAIMTRFKAAAEQKKEEEESSDK